jgi:hypothetical protein
MPPPFKSADADPDAFHQQLAHFNGRRIAPAFPSVHWQADLATEHDWRVAEGDFLEALRLGVAPLLPAPALSTDAFIAWFEDLATDGPGQQHDLFDWLADSATLLQMRWFLTQEAAGEAGFDDLLAYTGV